MDLVDDGDGHVRQAVAAYLVGALTAKQDAAVEAHLARCPRCLAESVRLGPVIGHLAVLDPVDADQLSAS